jgi:cellulose synthase operon protein C
MMLRALGRLLSCCLAFGSIVFILVDPAAVAKSSDAYLRDAEHYSTKGNLRGAEIELRNAIKEFPNDPAVRARLADVYLQQGNFASAEREARAAGDLGADEKDFLPILADALLRRSQFGTVLAAIQPGSRDPVLESKLRLALGVAATATRDLDRAEEMLRDAVRLDPSAENPKLQLARFLNEKHGDEANEVIDAAIAANPHSIEALQVKGEILRARGDQDAAKRMFDDVLRLDAKNTRALLSRAEISIDQGDLAAADADIGSVLRVDPNHFLANYLRGLEFFKQHNYLAADRICDRISSGFSNFPAGYYLQGATKFSLGQFSKAETILGNYLSRVPDDARAVRLTARAALQQHRASRAIDYLKPLADKSSRDAATLAALGEAYMADGKPALALQQFEKAAALDPQDPTIKTKAAVSAIDAGDRQLGLLQLEQVFGESETGATAAGPALALGELRAGHVDKAADVVATLIKRDAANPLYQWLLGVVRVAQHDKPGAEAAFRAALAREPGFSAAARDLAQLYLAVGGTSDARKIYTEFLSKKPDDVTGLLGLADIAIAEEKWSEAIDNISRARSVARDDPAPGLKLVSLYEKRRDWNSAKSVAGELATRFPRDANVIEAQARSQFEAGNTTGALSSYRLAHELAPSSAPILSRYIALLNQTKNFREARDVLRDAVDREPRNRSLKAELIRTEAEVDGLDGALFEARRLAKDDPEGVFYDLISAELYEKAGRAPAAVGLLEKTAAAHPSDDNLIIVFSRLLSRIGDFARAEAALRSRLQEDPKNVAIGAALAPLYMAIGRPDAAKAVYRDLLAQRQTDIGLLLALADIAISERNWPEASTYIARAQSAAPNDPAATLTLVNMHALRQDWNSATAAVAELAKKFPKNSEVLDAQARVQLGSGDTEGAVVTYKQAHELDPHSFEALSRYLALLKAAKKFREVRTVLQAALERDPQNTSIKAEMIRVEAETGGLDAGLAQALILAAQNPDESTYDLLSAEFYERSARAEEGIALLEKAVVADGANDRRIIALSGLYRRSGDPAKAEAVLSHRLKSDPTAQSVRSALASLYLQQKRYDAAFPELARLLAENPSDPIVLNNLAWLYHQQGDLVKARELAQRAFAITPRAPSVEDTLGWILLAQGDADKALTYLSAANLSAPHNPDIQYHFAVALYRVGRRADAQAMFATLLGSGVSFSDKDEAERFLRELKQG